MRFIFAILLTLALAAPAYAAFQGPGSQGGFSGPGSQAAGMTVQQAKNLPDDSRVTLTGCIINQLPRDSEKYTFKDATGEIVVDIDHKYFRGQNVTPQNTVRITGEVDREFGRGVEIDVKSLEVLN